jgi:hypothetical protein
MNERTERARYLGEQLTAAMDALGTETRGPDVVVFLDRLARLEAYPPSELTAVPGLPELVAEAVSARSEHAEELGKIAGYAFDLDHLLDVGRHLPADDAGSERDSWLRDVLVLATVAPWLSSARRAQAKWALEKANAMIEADAEAFLDASVLVSDRRILEAPDSLGDEAREFLRVLADLPLVVAFDRAPARASMSRVDAVLRRVDRHTRAAADDALADHEERDSPRLPSRSEAQALAAADESHATLVQMEGGAWTISRHRGRLRLSFEGTETDLGVVVLDGPSAGSVAADHMRAFHLPFSDEGLTIRLRVGPDSRVIRLEAGAE